MNEREDVKKKGKIIMKINNQQLTPKQLLQLYKKINIKQNNKIEKSTLTSNLSNKLSLPPSLRKLDSSLQKIILRNWIQQDLPLKENDLQKLVSLIKNSNLNINNKQLIKAASFLAKNNLPLSSYLLKGTARFLNGKSSISQNLNNFPNLKEQLSVNLFHNPEQIKSELEQYFKNTGKILQQLVSSETKNNSNLKEQLMGQQAINARRDSLLFVEIPLFFTPQKDTPLPLFLKYSQSADNNADEKNRYSLEFIIELPSLGTIRAEVLIEKDKIYSSFKVSAEQTAELIEKYFPELQQRLSKKGFNALKPEIGEFQNEKPIMNFLNENYSEDDTTLHHINFKV